MDGRGLLDLQSELAAAMRGDLPGADQLDLIEMICQYPTETIQGLCVKAHALAIVIGVPEGGTTLEVVGMASLVAGLQALCGCHACFLEAPKEPDKDSLTPALERG